MALHRNIRPIHPFPARMAPELAWDELPDNSKQLRVLDPMSGSGTTLVTAKMRGHEAVGFDRDPLAVLIARTWLRDIEPDLIEKKAQAILLKARQKARSLAIRNAYPRGANEETKTFVRYWFDTTNRVQLTALAESIRRVRDDAIRDYMWCAFSRLIVTKKVGASLAMDVSHSRPHKTYEKAPINAFDQFEKAVKYIATKAPFKYDGTKLPKASVDFADARKLPVKDKSVDLVLTSPPYLNAIDYIRGHKFSLIWMGHQLEELRLVRSTNVGTESTVSSAGIDDSLTDKIMSDMCTGSELSKRNAGMLRRYVWDMRAIISEIQRVLKNDGKAVFVVGNCNVRETFVQNSKCVEALGVEIGMKVSKVRSRPLPENRRYLPPPESMTAGKALKKRMREEVIITLVK